MCSRLFHKDVYTLSIGALCSSTSIKNYSGNYLLFVIHFLLCKVDNERLSKVGAILFSFVSGLGALYGVSSCCHWLQKG